MSPPVAWHLPKFTNETKLICPASRLDYNIIRYIKYIKIQYIKYTSVIRKKEPLSHALMAAPKPISDSASGLTNHLASARCNVASLLKITSHVSWRSCRAGLYMHSKASFQAPAFPQEFTTVLKAIQLGPRLRLEVKNYPLVVYDQPSEERQFCQASLPP